MSFDYQMARGAEDGWTNLAVGEPVFLQKLFLNNLWIDNSHFKPLTYPTLGGEPELVEELHRHFPLYKRIVVTVGAKQAIEAAFYAFKMVEHRTTVLHTAPYWPSYPTLAKSQGLYFNVGNAPRTAAILCVTSPNNPDGRQEYLFKSLPEIWDAAYAQPLYGYRGMAPPHRVAVFSAAKYLGLSGIRIGWLATNDDAIADAAAHFVEITTSGAPVNSQMHLLGCLETIRNPEHMEHLTRASFEARAALMTNGSSFNEILGDLMDHVHKPMGVPIDGSGMFAWFKPEALESMNRALRDAKVKIVTGEACGQPGWIRMSMGLMPEETQDALVRIRHQYFAGWVGK